jgi:chromosomal replication initiation ATPase DnaA
MDRDHTTILYGVKKIEEATSPDILRDLEILNGVLDRLELEVRFGSN